MKLTRHVSRRVGDREYHKWTVNLSPGDVEALGWEAGTELEGTVAGDALVLRPRTSPKED